MKGFFITGTDTDVGKTYITARLARQYLAQKQAVAVRKPVASGCGDDLKHCADAQALARATGEDEFLVTPYRFTPAVSPAKAMQESGNLLRLQDLISACQRQTEGKLCLVEGAGGWLSPLTPNASNADLALALDLPIILVVANRLGCINHTLLSLHHLYSMGLVCERVILNDVLPTQSSDYDAYDELIQYIPQTYPQVAVDKVRYQA